MNATAKKKQATLERQVSISMVLLRGYEFPERSLQRIERILLMAATPRPRGRPRKGDNVIPFPARP